MNLAAPFVRRPVATSLLTIGVLIVGIVSFFLMPVATLPRVDFPTITVAASLPGASPETMASAVATPLERRFGRIAGVTEITSASGLSTSQITLQFDLSRDVESAARDVQAAITASAGELPPNMPSRPSYRKANPADTPVLIAALTSETLPLPKLFELASTVLAPKISQVRGVGQVTVGGGQQPAVRVRFDPEVLAGLGVTVEELRLSIAQATIASAKGSLDDGRNSYVLAANDQLYGADAFGHILIPRPGSEPIRLSDAASVVDGVENDRVAAWSNGRRSVLLIVRGDPAANVIETTNRVKALVPDLMRASPQVNIDLAFDRTDSIRSSVREVERTLMVSVILVVLVVFAFLGSPRATIVPAIAVPLSLVATFAVMLALGYSLDNLSLMALTVSTGFLVDDAIVVTENVARLVEEGVEPKRAALQGAAQIGFTIVSITASLLAVFIPVLFMGGIVGRFFREFAVTLAVSVFVSGVISLTVTPTICALLLRAPRRHSNDKPVRWTPMAALTRAYGGVLRVVVRHRFAMGGVVLTTLGASVWLYIAVPKGLFPQQDGVSLVGISEAPQDVSFAAMVDRQSKIDAVVAADPDIRHVISLIGGGSGSSVNTGTTFILLAPRSERTGTGEQVISRLRPQIAKVGGMNLFLHVAQDVRIGARPSRTQFQYTLQSANLEDLRLWTPKMLEAFRGLRVLKDVASDQLTAGLDANVRVDRDRASMLGVSMSDIDSTLYDAFGQRQVATAYTERNAYRVVVEMEPSRARSLDSVGALFVRSSSGALVPLRELISIRPGSTPLSVNHQGQFASATLSFNLAPGVALGQAVEAIRATERSLGLPGSIRGDFQGTAQAFGSSLDSQPYLILAALLTVYLVLGMLYESFVHPITILSSLPSAGAGAIAALMILKIELSVIAMIGLLLLVGVVKKNSIILVDFALVEERERGASPERAVVDAAMSRFRPILMTSVAAFFGALPLILFGGDGAELRRPLGIVIVGGLLVSQPLTLFTTPVIYIWLARLRGRPSGAAAGVEGTNSGAL